MTRKIATLILFSFALFSVFSAFAQTSSDTKIDSLLFASNNEKDPIEKGFLLLELAEAHTPNDMEKLIYYSKRACKEHFPAHRTKEDERQIKEIYGRANNNIGYAYNIQGRHVEALSYYNKALSIFKEIKDNDGISKLYNNIGGIYKVAGEFKKAEKLYLEGLALLEGSNDSLSIAIFENNLGLIYKNLGDSERAIKHF